MNECQQLQRTIVRDIMAFCEDGTIKDVMDTIHRGAEFGSAWLNANKRQNGSIASRASQLVLVFPVLVSTSLKMETAVLISKAIEKKCVSLLQLLFSAANLNDYHDTKDLYDYISKYHTNLDMKHNTSITLDDFINAIDTMTANHEMTVINKDIYNAVMAEMRAINNTAKDWFRESSVNDFSVKKTAFGETTVTLEDAGYLNDRRHDTSDVTDFFKAQIIPSDVNKVNELVPTMMMVNFITTKDGNVINQTGIVGVKAKLYPVESMEIIGRLSSKYSDSHTLFNLIRCSTKEKSFFKDFAFALEKTKMDAINVAKGSVNSRLFKALERRADKNKTRLLKSGRAEPITTLVVSQEEVEYLKKYSNMDLESMSAANVIFSGYNLMGIVIVDDSIEIAKFLYDDGSNSYETISFDALAKEDKNGDYKKIVNLMARMNH